ncbi:MAG: hypothetical protein RLY86_4414 [Pseudomonadota bacterium]|jgi:AcrR family transcriptional regulator
MADRVGERKERAGDLREACVAEAQAIIATEGVEGLSLREVARRLGVSHQAPYRHFPSRDHILAEVVARAFDHFARALDARNRSEDPHQDLGGMGVAYLAYAVDHPLEYRLMFATPLPDPAHHPGMMGSARHAFALLVQGLARMRAAEAGGAPGPACAPAEAPETYPDAGPAAGAAAETLAGTEAYRAVLLDALFIWSALHGLAGITGSSTVGTLGLPPGLLESAPQHLLTRIGHAMAGPPVDGDDATDGLGPVCR